MPISARVKQNQAGLVSGDRDHADTWRWSPRRDVPIVAPWWALFVSALATFRAQSPSRNTMTAGSITVARALRLGRTANPSLCRQAAEKRTIRRPRGHQMRTPRARPRLTEPGAGTDDRRSTRHIPRTSDLPSGMFGRRPSVTEIRSATSEVSTPCAHSTDDRRSAWTDIARRCRPTCVTEPRCEDRLHPTSGRSWSPCLRSAPRCVLLSGATETRRLQCKWHETCRGGAMAPMVPAAILSTTSSGDDHFRQSRYSESLDT